MKALVKAHAEPGLWLQDIPEPTIGINDVLIKVLKTGICGTDLHIYNWDAWAQKTIKPPMTIGHEYVGVIDAVGSNVADHRPGELVVGEGHIVCGACRNCLAGRRHLCPNTQALRRTPRSSPSTAAWATWPACSASPRRRARRARLRSRWTRRATCSSSR